nr:MAG TPA: regulatory protein [Caudoviricetes sp.]
MSNLVSLANGRVTTSSLIVAQHFNKRHANVLRAIQNLECSENFTQLNFELSEYKDDSSKTNKYYIITKDGFMFLVMGFTGKEAALWKERFINAFNEMEASLRTRQEIPYLFEPDKFNDIREKARQYMESLRKNPEQVSQGSIPNDVVAGMIAMQMAGRNFSLHVDYEGKLFVQPMQNPYETLPQAIADPGNIGLEDETIWKIFHACVTTLERRAKNREAWIKARTKS